MLARGVTQRLTQRLVGQDAVSRAALEVFGAAKRASVAFFEETFDVDWDNVLPEIPEPAFLIVGQDETFDSDWWDT